MPTLFLARTRALQVGATQDGRVSAARHDLLQRPPLRVALQHRLDPGSRGIHLVHVDPEQAGAVRAVPITLAAVRPRAIPAPML